MGVGFGQICKITLNDTNEPDISSILFSQEIDQIKEARWCFMRSWRGQGERCNRHTSLTQGLKQLAYHLRSAFASFKAGRCHPEV